MSDKNGSDDKRRKETPEGKIIKKKKTGTVKEDESRNPDEPDKKITSNEEEGPSKQPMLKKELTKLLDDFGQVKPDLPLNYSPTVSPAPQATTNQNDLTESYPLQSSENNPSVDDMRENTKESTEDSTLEGKIIESRDVICDCQEVKCDCDQTDQNATDVDDSQIQCKNDEMILPYDCDCHQNHNAKVYEQSYCDCKEPKVKKTDRYNYNQVQVRQKPIDEAPFDNFFPRREIARNKRRIIKEESGETIPQLYKANVKNLSNFGIAPERFTFKAVTGNLPGKLEYGQNVYCPCMHPCPPSSKYGFSYLCEKFKPGKRQKIQKKDKYFFRHFRKNRRNDHLEKKTCFNHEYDLLNKHKSDRACMELDGNEYVSTKQLPDRIDIYCFDHLNTSFFRTCDQPPPLITEIAMEKTEGVATRFWAEIFGFVHIIIAFFIAFILQFYKFILYSIIRPIMVGLVQLTSDYFFKPLLTITYNGFTQPLLVFLFNVAASFRDLCSPIAKALGYFVSEIAVLLRAIRLVDCNKYASPHRQMKDSCC